MLKRLWAAVLAAGLVAGAAGAADEAITIKLKKAGKGDVVKETKTEDVTNDATITVGGQEMKQNEKSSSKFVYTDEILERGEKDPKPTKLKRTYETADVTKMGKEVDLGLKGKTVAIEKGKDKYTFTVADGKLGDEAKEVLDKEFNKKDDVDAEELMLPKKAVKVGDTWEVDVKAVEKMFGEEMSVDKDKTKVTGKLVKVYDKDKAKFGVVEYTMELPIASLKIMDQSVPATAGSKLKLTVSLDGCLDGTVYGGTSTGKMEGELGLKVPMAEVAIKLSGTMASKSEAVKK
jgi:hypothetical protein